MTDLLIPARVSTLFFAYKNRVAFDTEPVAANFAQFYRLFGWFQSGRGFSPWDHHPSLATKVFFPKRNADETHTPKNVCQSAFIRASTSLGCHRGNKNQQSLPIPQEKSILLFSALAIIFFRKFDFSVQFWHFLFRSPRFFHDAAYLCPFRLRYFMILWPLRSKPFHQLPNETNLSIALR